MKNHSKYRNFKFILENGKSVMWYKEGSRNTLQCGYNDTDGLQILRNVQLSPLEIMLPKEIDDNNFKDVFKKNVQELLSDEDKQWWTNFKKIVFIYVFYLCRGSEKTTNNNIIVILFSSCLLQLSNLSKFCQANLDHKK